MTISRRDLLAAGGAVAATAAIPPPEAAFAAGIEKTERFLEFMRLRERLAGIDPLDRSAFAETWNRIILLQQKFSPRPTTPTELLEYATVMLHWNTAIADGALDPCEALMRTRKHRRKSYLPEQAAVDLGAAVFALAGYRAQSFVRWVHLREDPDL